MIRFAVVTIAFALLAPLTACASSDGAASSNDAIPPVAGETAIDAKLGCCGDLLPNPYGGKPKCRVCPETLPNPY